MEIYFMIQRISDNYYLADREYWESKNLTSKTFHWSSVIWHAKRFISIDELKTFIEEDQREENKELEIKSGFNQFDKQYFRKQDFLILTGVTI